MNKLNAFLVVATADNISKMSNDEISLLSELLADVKNGEKLSDFISFQIQDKSYYTKNIEVQEPVC
jgi:hypothetical protein